MSQTSEYWRDWLSRGDVADHPWRGILERSALTLKGLSYAPSGALAAAPTTSLPRVPRGDRNYDYRYTFIRDAWVQRRNSQVYDGNPPRPKEEE